MYAFVRKLGLAMSAGLMAAPAFAGTNGLYLPSPPSGPGGEDSIETSTGTRCRQSMNSNGAYVDMGVTGTASSPLPVGTNGIGVFSDTRDREASVYARVTIPIGSRPERIDCSQIYKLEIERLKREVELLRMNAH